MLVAESTIEIEVAVMFFLVFRLSEGEIVVVVATVEALPPYITWPSK